MSPASQKPPEPFVVELTLNQVAGRFKALAFMVS